MTNVVELKKEPEANVIGILEELLERAKKGQISYIACVTVEDVIKTNYGGTGNALEVLGSIVFLQNEYLKHCVKRV